MLSQCEGYEKHLKNYTKSQFYSNFFTGAVAVQIKGKFGSVALEPCIDSNGKCPDILLNFDGRQYYFECKTIHTRKFDYRKEHERIFNIIRPYIKYPHQIQIEYYESLTDEEVNSLGKSISELLPQVKAEGYIINNSRVRVSVVPRAEYGLKGFVMVLEGRLLSPSCTYKSDIFFADGMTIGIDGPVPDFRKTIKRIVSKGRHQNDPNSPYVLVIDGSAFLGVMENNMRAIQEAFKPNMNTRMSGVLVVNREYFDKTRSYKFDYVSNPFSKYPLPERMVNLLRTG